MLSKYILFESILNFHLNFSAILFDKTGPTHLFSSWQFFITFGIWNATQDIDFHFCYKFILFLYFISFLREQEERKLGGGFRIHTYIHFWSLALGR